MDSVLAVINKYKDKLNTNENPSKILQALRNLDEMEMTISILKKTGIGKAVKAMKKVKNDTIAILSHQIVSKWKSLLTHTKNTCQPKQIQYTSQPNHDNDEYNPSGNREMKKQKLPGKAAQNVKKDIINNISRSIPSSLSTGFKAREKHALKYDIHHHNNNKKIESYNKENISDQHQKDSVSDVEYISSKETESAVTSRGDKSNFDDSENASSYIPSFNKTRNKQNYDMGYTNNIHVNESKRLGSNSQTKYNSNRKISHHNKSSTASKSNELSKCNFSSSKAVKNPSNSRIVHSGKIESSVLQATNGKHGSASNSRKRKSSPFSTNNRRNSKKTKLSSDKFNGSIEQTKKSKAGEFSFEQFMLMDTSKVKKKTRKITSSVPSQLRKTVGGQVSKPKIKLHLPKVQATYRPLRNMPKNRVTNSLPKQPNKLTDAMAAELHTQKFSKRMQIYSGKKTAVLSKMVSLYDQCMNVLMNNIDKLDVIGVPYDIIKPVLKRCTVEQLYRLEDSNVYLLDDTDELWQKHAMLEFPNEQPQEMESWREMYLRLHDAREAKLAKLTHSIQSKLNKARPLEKRTKLAYVGIGHAKAPRNVLRAQLKYGTAGKNPVPHSSYKSQSQVTSSSSTSLRQQVKEVRMSVPVGSITADSVDNQRSGQGFAKKQAPRIAPMMAKTLKSIKQRYKR